MYMTWLIWLQITLYKEILRSKTVASLLSNSDAKEGVLHIITMLKKLCNHPDLLHMKGERGTVSSRQADKLCQRAADSRL